MKRLTLAALIVSASLVLSGCASKRYRMAIMDFDVSAAGSGHEKLRTAMPELMTQNLDKYRSIFLLERQDVRTYFAEIDAQETERARLTRWQKVGRKLGAEYLVVGSVVRLGPNYVLNVRLFNVKRGEVAPGSSFTQSCIQESDIYERTRTLSFGIDQYLRRRTLPAAPRQAPSSPLSLPVVNAPTREAPRGEPR